MKEEPSHEDPNCQRRGNHWRGRRGCRGGRGGHGGNNPFKHMVQQFFNNMMQNAQTSSSSDSDSDSEEQRKQRREAAQQKRPVIIAQDLISELNFANETVIFDITVQNQTKWPVHIESIKKIAPSDINFEGIEIGTVLKHEETTKLSIPVTMPSQPGSYSIQLGFFSKKGQTGEVLDLNFNVSDDLY